MPPLLLIAVAVLAEVAGTISLRFSEGFTRLVPSLITIAGYVTAFWMLGQALKAGMPVGVAYGIWAAAGVSLVAIIGAAFLGESLSWVQIGGIVLVVGGVVALEMGGKHA
ncbi:DMT family transporter [Nocardiopsis coralliicola]